MFSLITAARDEVQVRLAEGRGSFQGRVELLHNDVWGTVCDDGWDLEDAHVICRQLGFTGAGEAVLGGAFGEGKGPILLDEIACQGTERGLEYCGHNGWEQSNCDHSEDAGVVCLQGNGLSIQSQALFQSIKHLFPHSHHMEASS